SVLPPPPLFARPRSVPQHGTRQPATDDPPPPRSVPQYGTRQPGTDDPTPPRSVPQYGTRQPGTDDPTPPRSVPQYGTRQPGTDDPTPPRSVPRNGTRSNANSRAFVRLSHRGDTLRSVDELFSAEPIQPAARRGEQAMPMPRAP